VLPAADESVLVTRVRFGRGGLIFTVTPADGGSPEEERHLTLSTEVRIRKRGRDLAR
jgi:hypothetical protein